jgi:hypothetical protein
VAGREAPTSTLTCSGAVVSAPVFVPLVLFWVRAIDFRLWADLPGSRRAERAPAQTHLV